MSFCGLLFLACFGGTATISSAQTKDMKTSSQLETAVFGGGTLYMHGQDNVYLGNGVAANDPGSLPPGAAGPSWNGGFVEAHYSYSPQLIFTGRYELVHMSRQANAALAATPNLGNVDSWTIGYRWYPIMFSRAGLAFHNEYAQAKAGNTSILAGSDQTSRSVLIGFDFDY